MVDKKLLHEHCMLLLKEKSEIIKKALADLMQSLNDDVKSSVGDKHETSRAMLHLEMEKLNSGETSLKLMIQHLQKLDPVEIYLRPSHGSLLKTNHGYFYISIPLGRIKFGDEFVNVISPGSPVGEIICKLGDEKKFEYSGVQYRIESIS